MKMRNSLAILFFAIAFSCHSQDTIPNKKRLNLVKYGGLSTYAVGMVGLDRLWYGKSPRSSFHFFNDAAEWKQLDKVGHIFSAFQLSSATGQAFVWANSKEKTRVITSALVGFALVSSIEIFDGLSPDYGASIGDLTANATGSLLYFGQMAAWKEIRIQPKFSFSRSRFANQNPDLLGDGIAQEIFKDYNGQTYWLCLDTDKFFRFPKWLNLAVGYGATNMINARAAQNIDPYRQYYLSFDFDLKSIPTRSKFLKTVIFLVSMIKLPAPTIEFSKHGVRSHAFYF